MRSFVEDLTSPRFVARRVTAWRQREGAVILEIEGVREPDETGIAAVLSGAPLNDAVDRAELTVSVLEMGAVRLQFGAPILRDAGLLDPDEITPAHLSVTSGEGTLRIASERHSIFGPDPEDLTIEIVLDPIGLAVVDSSGRPLVRLAADDAEQGADPNQPRRAPFSWAHQTDREGGLPGTAISLALDADERLAGLGERAGPLNLVGRTVTVPTGGRRPPFLLSSRGYGLLIHTTTGLTAELGERAPGVYSLGVEEPALDLLIFPSTWPRTALAGYARLTGRAEMVPDHAFDLAGAGDVSAPATVDEMRARLQLGLSFGLAEPGFWRADVNAPASEGVNPAVLARWAQLALLSPLVGIGAGVPTSPSWADPRARAVLQAYLRLRYRLLPYLHHCARETAQGGLPMLRPLLLEFAWDADAATIDDQYLLGRDLLVAPVFSDSPEPVVRRVYLPAYANWYDWWTGTLYEGRQWIETTVPLERVPIFVRAGTTIPLGDASAGGAASTSGGGTSVEATRLLLFAPREGAIGSSVELAEDDLLGVEQERGDRKARVYVEGILRSIRDLEIVGLPIGTRLVDASAPSITLSPGDGQLPGLGGTWNSVMVRLEAGAFTAGLELGW